MNKHRISMLHIDDYLNFNSNCNIYLFDEEHRVIRSNQHMLKMFKKLLELQSEDQILNQFIGNIIAPDLAKVVIEENNLVMSTGKTHQFLNRAVFSKAQHAVLLTVKTPAYDEHGKINGVFGISHILSIYNITGSEFATLTSRERDCLALLAKGKTAPQIAKSLKLSTRTIEFYLENIKGKLGCQSKADLHDKVFQLGLATLTMNATSEAFKTGVFLINDDDDKVE